MTSAQALLWLKLFVAAAASDLGIQPPPVEVVSLDDRFAKARMTALAYVPHCTGEEPHCKARIVFMRETVETFAAHQASRRAQTWLRCVARHEVAHVALGHHQPAGNTNDDFRHRMVGLLMESRWKEESSCVF